MLNCSNLIINGVKKLSFLSSQVTHRFTTFNNGPIISRERTHVCAHGEPEQEHDDGEDESDERLLGAQLREAVTDGRLDVLQPRELWTQDSEFRCKEQKV